MLEVPGAGQLGRRVLAGMPAAHATTSARVRTAAMSLRPGDWVCSLCMMVNGHWPDCYRARGLRFENIGYSENKETEMDKTNSKVLRGLQWIAEHAGGDLEACSGDKAGAFAGTSEREVEAALNWLESFIKQQGPEWKGTYIVNLHTP